MSTDKVAVITGAGSGIGAATAKRFAKDGFKVVLFGRTADKLNKIASDIAAPEQTLVVTGDVSKESDVANLIDTTVTNFGRIDVLVNNAATFIGGSIDQLSLADWNHQFAVNTTGPFLTIKTALAHLQSSKGSIVNVSSVSGLGGDWGAFGYDATKGALNLMTQALALDFAPKGVRINAVAPTLTSTDMTEFLMDNKPVLDAFKSRIAMQRIGQPEDIADVIRFLASDDARFVTGTIIPVDGGLSASNGQPQLT